MIRILLLVDCANDFDRNLLRGIVRYSRENGPWLFYRLPSYYRSIENGERSILEWAKAWKADAIIGQLKDYLSKGYDMILTSHYTPEDLKDVRTKIDYLENLKQIAGRCGNADAFKAEVRKAYPGYSGENYLDMTAGFFFG